MDEDQIPKIGEDVTALMPALGDDVTALMSSHAPPPRAPAGTYAQYGPLSQLLRDAYEPEQNLQELKANAPAIGATLAGGAASLGSGGFLLPVIAAGGGGYLGARARGDDRERAASEGVKQAALEGGGRAVMGAGGLVARGLMKGTVPKNIAKDFDQVDIPQQMLNRGIVPGVPASARRVGRMSEAANVEREAAAATVPTMPRRKIIEGWRPIHAEGVAGRPENTVVLNALTLCGPPTKPEQARSLAEANQLVKKETR